MEVDAAGQEVPSSPVFPWNSVSCRCKVGVSLGKLSGEGNTGKIGPLSLAETGHCYSFHVVRL